MKFYFILNKEYKEKHFCFFIKTQIFYYTSLNLNYKKKKYIMEYLKNKLII